jgi:hypothetical protein
MAAKKVTKQVETKKPLMRKEVQVKVNPTDTPEDQARKMASTILSPALSSYRVLRAAESESALLDKSDVPSLMKELREQSDAVNCGDMSHLEKMLSNQATSLQSLFARMTERGMAQSQMPHIEGFMRLALKAQNQCRATIETLAAIKNPPVIYAKQANISNGHQQINNGIPSNTRTHAHTGNILNQQNELLEVNHGGETVDSGTTGATSRKNKAMATVD